ncbi:hypothetical protein CDD80_782 [Ophiocordyceps camponoti-rufipedis]|uniref:Uncharacterized protein n=1 Tax=Ophiocordyceps camponoti-rufipedis TaxID=2004952 RepID=A0A2C5ZC03_9HYPO|nr:hypothetical protein CDD80_782 [Ophiocordyceps camponoti-rufipedis]
MKAALVIMAACAAASPLPPKIGQGSPTAGACAISDEKTTTTAGCSERTFQPPRYIRKTAAKTPAPSQKPAPVSRPNQNAPVQGDRLFGLNPAAAGGFYTDFGARRILEAERRNSRFFGFLR